MKCWLGVDCGSVSVKFALIDEDGNLLDSLYLRNEGITETVQRGLKKICNDDYEVVGTGCTGSGRQFLKIIMGADIVKTEILAHTIATLQYYPEARTIMDIGGEDCKIMEIRDGVLTSFIMNNVCGAGTGAVIEAIASRLGMRIEEVGDLALSSTQKLDFPGKCGIFCQSAVVSRLNAGAAKSDIMMGVVRALINNYLTLARGIQLSPPYVFQGATARNGAMIQALEEQLDHDVIVPPQCAVMGAIGIALMARESGIARTRFRGFHLDALRHRSMNLRCEDCPNQCEVTQLYEGEKFLGGVGSRCGKWDARPRVLGVPESGTGALAGAREDPVCITLSPS